MGFSFGVAEWSNSPPEILQRIQEHAAYKARDPINWDEWLQIKSERGMSCGLPYSVGAEFMADVLEARTGQRGLHSCYFVPYVFDTELSPTFPAPLDFWRDDITPSEWQNDGTLVVVEGAWAHDTWRGIEDDEYRERAERYAARFDEVYGQLDEIGANNFDERYDLTYHYLEVWLIRFLNYAVPRNLPVVVYP